MKQRAVRETCEAASLHVQMKASDCSGTNKPGSLLPNNTHVFSLYRGKSLRWIWSELLGYTNKLDLWPALMQAETYDVETGLMRTNVKRAKGKPKTQHLLRFLQEGMEWTRIWVVCLIFLFLASYQMNAGLVSRQHNRKNLKNHPLLWLQSTNALLKVASADLLPFLLCTKQIFTVVQYKATC